MCVICIYNRTRTFWLHDQLALCTKPATCILMPDGSTGQTVVSADFSELAVLMSNLVCRIKKLVLLLLVDQLVLLTGQLVLQTE